MIARFITYNGPFGAETIALCLARPNWRSEPKVTPSLPTDIATHPISLHESRRTFAGASRYALEYATTTKNAADSTELRIWLNRLKDELVAVPLWTDRCEFTAAIPIGAVNLPVDDHPVRYGLEWIIIAADQSDFEIVKVSSSIGTGVNLIMGTAKAWPIGAAIYPLMFGRLTDRPELTAVTTERSECTFKFKENSVYARRLNPYSIGVAQVGAGIPTLATLPLWTFEPNHVRLLDRTEVDIIYQLLGFGRVESQKVYLSANRRGLSFDLVKWTRDDLAAVERFFFDRRATTRPFLSPTFRSDLRLTSDLAPGASIFPIEPSEFTNPARPSHPGDPYIALVDRIGVEARKLNSFNSTNLVASVGVSRAHSMDLTRLSHLLLVRFVDASLQWTYHDDSKASTQIKFLEQPNDYANGGVNLKEPVYLYRFTTQLSVIQPVQRFTSYENQFVTNLGEVFTPADLSWEAMEAGIDLNDKVEVSCSPFTGNPFAEFFPFTLEAIKRLDILEADAANPTAAPKNLFSGEIAVFDPKAFKATVDLGRVLDGKHPSFLLSTIDNYSLFDPGLQLAQFTWQIAGTIQALNEQTINITSTPGNAKPADYFAHGYLVTGIGATEESRAILSSSPITGGVQLIIDRPLIKAVVGQDLVFFPGYDGTIDQLESRFNDRINHGGHPYAPDTPPNIKVLKTKAATGGKKG